jgi:TolA-binding protein
MKKAERHQIKRDELATVLERGLFYLEGNLKRIGLVAAVLVVLLLAGLGLMKWSQAHEAEASFQLSHVIQTYRAPVAASLEQLEQAPVGVKSFASEQLRDQAVVKLADDLLARFPSTKAAPQALYYKALALRSLKKYDEGAAALETFLRDHPDDFLAPMARFELARIREEQGKPDQALVEYQVLADDTRGLFPAEEGLLGMARCQEAMGHKDEARKTYQRVLDDHFGSDYQAEARRRIDDLS